MEIIDFYGDFNSYHSCHTDIVDTENPISYSLHFFDKDSKNLYTIDLDEDSFYDDRMDEYKLPKDAIGFSFIFSYLSSDKSIRFQIICNFILENYVSIIDSQLITFHNGEKLFGDFRVFQHSEELEKFFNYIIDSFYQKKLPLQGEYISVMKKMEFIKK